MLIALTGTPGTGKTTAATVLREKGYGVLDLNEHIRTNGLLDEFDEVRETHDVDTERLDSSLMKYRNADHMIFAEGHLSHFLECDMIVVLRCNPSILYERLTKRGYALEKVLENVQAEALDVILCESLDSGKPVYEIDCTSSETNNIISALEHILEGNTDKYIPGSVNWGEEMVKWC